MNRSPLERKTALRRSTKGLTRRAINRVSRKRRREKPARDAVREAVLRRDGGCRLAWLGGCYGALTYHHILKAGQGGEYTEENGACLCERHNDLIESDIEVAAFARAAGLVTFSWEAHRGTT